MTETQAQILELFQTLTVEEQRELVVHLVEQATRGSFFERMTPEQRTQLEDGINEVKRGDVVAWETVSARLKAKLKAAGI